VQGSRISEARFHTKHGEFDAPIAVIARFTGQLYPDVIASVGRGVFHAECRK